MPAYSRILLPWDSQPQEYAAVNPDFWLPLEFAWSGAQTLVDVVSGLPWTRGTGLTDDVHVFGRGVSGSSGATGFSRSNAPTTAQTQYTFIAVLKRTGTIAYQSIFISSGTNAGVSLACDSGGTTLSWVKRGVTSFGSLTLPLNEEVCIVCSHDQTSGTYYMLMRNMITGAVTRSAGTDTNGSSAGNGTYRLLRGHDNSFAGSLGVAGFAFRYLPEALAYGIRDNPWQIFAPRSIWVPVGASAAGGPVSGSLAATESGADVAALAGDVLVSGSLAATESGGDTAALAGTIAVVGALAATESGSDTAALQGLLGAGPVTGSIAATESGSDVAALAGLVAIVGTLDAAESGSDTASFRAPSSAQEVYGSTGYWPSPKRKTKREIDDERRRRLGLPVEVLEAVAAAPVERRKIVLADLIGKPKAARITRVDLSEAITLHKRRKRQRDDEMLMLM